MEHEIHFYKFRIHWIIQSLQLHLRLISNSEHEIILKYKLTKTDKLKTCETCYGKLFLYPPFKKKLFHVIYEVPYL